MESGSGEQIDTSNFVMPNHPECNEPFEPPRVRKRDQNPSAHHSNQSRPPLSAESQNPSPNWNPRMWEWDSLHFSAKPVQAPSPGPDSPPMDGSDGDKRDGEDGSDGSPSSKEGIEINVENQSLSLQLGGRAFSAEELAVSRPNKRVRSGSPGIGSGANYPMCQVNDCHANLSSAKDYHRRHKVCELHSKVAKAFVGKQMQRFCQQCSRFHPLLEFDEGKRSCRRRLDGHNRRRRKANSEDTSSQFIQPGNQDNNAKETMHIVNLLSLLARLQGKSADKLPNGPSPPDKEQLVQIISKLNSVPNLSSTSKSSAQEVFDLNISQQPQDCCPQLSNVEGRTYSPKTIDLLAVLDEANAGPAPYPCQTVETNDCSTAGKMKKIRSGELVSLNNSSKKLPSIDGDRTSCALQSSDAAEIHPILPFQLFSSTDDDSPPKLGSSNKYLSSESSNPLDDKSPPSSPPVAHKFFPMHSDENMDRRRVVSPIEDNMTVEASTSRSWNPPLELFKESDGRTGNGLTQNRLLYQASCTSSPGSDHSPSCSNSESHDRTGRIIFKLFDKDPSSIPGNLRTQILNWLSRSPSEMESHIRPGCVVLSIYMSMPSDAWDELEEDLYNRVFALIRHSGSEFWSGGRFLVRTSQQLASYNNGNVRLCRSWTTLSAPEITCVSPIAVISGQETYLIVRGRNLSIPGTKIHCTYMGGYTSKDVQGSVHPGTIYDDSSMETFIFHGGRHNVFGRCFIEVENGFKGNCFPVIVADAAICQELRSLDSEIMGVVTTSFKAPHKSREVALHFLNELGWLFQRKSYYASGTFIEQVSFNRFKFLLIFSIQRDWVMVVKTLLDMLAERSARKEGLIQEFLEILLEVDLLSRAVARKCKRMVDLLLFYSADIKFRKVFLFPPNMAGHGGMTPLHLAATMPEMEDIVDALVGDPEEIGLQCWNSVQDNNGRTPHSCASMRNNHSYNVMVERKLADKRNGQVSILFWNESSATPQREVEKSLFSAAEYYSRSCAQCATLAVQVRPVTRTRSLLHRPYVHSLLAIAAVCVCVCLFYRGDPDLGDIAPFNWENLEFGPR